MPVIQRTGLVRRARVRRFPRNSEPLKPFGFPGSSGTMTQSLLVLDFSGVAAGG